MRARREDDLVHPIGAPLPVLAAAARRREFVGRTNRRAAEGLAVRDPRWSAARGLLGRDVAYTPIEGEFADIVGCQTVDREEIGPRVEHFVQRFAARDLARAI